VSLKANIGQISPLDITFGHCCIWNIYKNSYLPFPFLATAVMAGIFVPAAW